MKMLTKAVVVSASLSIAAMPMASLAVDQATVPKAYEKCLKIEKTINNFGPALQSVMDSHFNMPTGDALKKYPTITASDTKYSYTSSTWADKTHYNYAISRDRWSTTLDYLKSATYSSGAKKGQHILDTSKLESLLGDFDTRKANIETLVNAKIAQLADKAAYPDLVPNDCLTKDGRARINARGKDLNGTVKSLREAIAHMYQKPIHNEIQALIKQLLNAKKDKTNPVDTSKSRGHTVIASPVG
ncbi:MAG TPA: hypothetical protein VLF21_00975 [Candidatus Saccharimonadales bacterium]|nr:hypothetical protein [Candidatus Saccharimonadales bacterium]